MCIRDSPSTPAGCQWTGSSGAVESTAESRHQNRSCWTPYCDQVSTVDSTDGVECGGCCSGGR
eukprot:11218252-Alexandrium_andersonii.AAC.1